MSKIADRCRAGALVAAVLAFLPATSRAGLTNGGFEDPPTSPGTFNQYSGGSTAITGWTVLGNDVLLINTTYAEPGNGINAFNANGGINSVDLTGAGNTGLTDGVQQVATTVAGQSYTLSFFVGRGDGGPLYSIPSTLNLQIDGGVLTPFTNANVTPGGINWEQFTTTFTATGTSTTIAFLNGTASGANNFVGLDDVSLNSVATPEPTTIVLAFAGIIPAVCLARRRARRSA